MKKVPSPNFSKNRQRQEEDKKTKFSDVDLHFSRVNSPHGRFVTDDCLTIMSSTVHDALTVSMKENKKRAEIMNDDSQ